MNTETRRVGTCGRSSSGGGSTVAMRFTRPSAGEIRTHGRVAALLELGAGFNPELTGRENVFLNGAWLGMSRADIRRKFDEIVAFWLVLWLWLPASWGDQLLAFILFRFFDMVKPGPVGWADGLFKGRRGWVGGWGILFDDLVAAFCTLLVLSLAVKGAWLK